MFHIVLVAPQIPQNNGNIARTCAVTGCKLHLVKPGFDISERSVRRAGLDYWDKVFVDVYEDFAQLQTAYPTAPFYLVETVGSRRYDQVTYPPGAFFGLWAGDQGTAPGNRAAVPGDAHPAADA